MFSSSADPADRYGAPQHKRPAHTGRIRRFTRIGILLAGGVFIIPGLLLLWHALLIPAGTDADRERRSQLKRELAAYSTPAQRRDLEATLDRYPDGITDEIRNILASQAVASHDNGTIKEASAGWLADVGR